MNNYFLVALNTRFSVAVTADEIKKLFIKLRKFGKQLARDMIGHIRNVGGLQKLDGEMHILHLYVIIYF